MGIADMIRRTFLEGYAAANLTPQTVLTCLVVTCVLGAYVFIIYRRITRDDFYNRNFNMSILAIAIITASIILTIQSNIVVSLGMVGALSIVRFRTAIKDPLDLIFLFWSIGIGIICGAGFALIAILMSLILTVVIYIFMKVRVGNNTVVLVVNTDSPDDEEEILKVVKDNCTGHRIRAKSATRSGLNLAIEVRLKAEDTLIKDLMGLENTTSASLVEHDGDITA